MSHPESTPIYKNDLLIRSWKDLNKRAITSLRHFDCALLIESNRKFIGVYHHPASDVDGEAAGIKIPKFQESFGNISTSCVIYRSKNQYSQADLIHKIEQVLGVKPGRIIDINLSEMFLSNGPFDITIDEVGIYAKAEDQTKLLISSRELRQ